MKPVPQLFPSTQAPPSSSGPSVPPEPAGGARVALRNVTLGLGAAAVAIAGMAAYALALLAGSAHPALAAAGAALGVLAAALPLGWLLARLAAQAGPGAGAASVPAAFGTERPLFATLAQREFARARRYGTGAAMLIVEVDRYARLCDARGAATGETVMRELLRHTAPALRTADVLTHHAESQMAVFLAHADATGALDVAERIRERAEQLQVAQPEPSPPLRLTVSVGVACLRPAHPNLQSMIDDAEEALQAARQAGGNCVRAAPIEGRARIGIPRGQRRAQPRQDGAS